MSVNCFSAIKDGQVKTSFWGDQISWTDENQTKQEVRLTQIFNELERVVYDKVSPLPINIITVVDKMSQLFTERNNKRSLLLRMAIKVRDFILPFFGVDVAPENRLANLRLHAIREISSHGLKPQSVSDFFVPTVGETMGGVLHEADFYTIFFKTYAEANHLTTCILTYYENQYALILFKLFCEAKPKGGTSEAPDAFIWLEGQKIVPHSKKHLPETTGTGWMPDWFNTNCSENETFYSLAKRVQALSQEEKNLVLRGFNARSQQFETANNQLNGLLNDLVQAGERFSSFYRHHIKPEKPAPKPSPYPVDRTSKPQVTQSPESPFIYMRGLFMEALNKIRKSDEKITLNDLLDDPVIKRACLEAAANKLIESAEIETTENKFVIVLGNGTPLYFLFREEYKDLHTLNRNQSPPKLHVQNGFNGPNDLLIELVRQSSNLKETFKPKTSLEEINLDEGWKNPYARKGSPGPLDSNQLKEYCDFLEREHFASFENWIRGHDGQRQITLQGLGIEEKNREDLNTNLRSVFNSDWSNNSFLKVAIAKNVLKMTWSEKWVEQLERIKSAAYIVLHPHLFRKYEGSHDLVSTRDLIRGASYDQRAMEAYAYSNNLRIFVYKTMDSEFSPYATTRLERSYFHDTKTKLPIPDLILGHREGCVPGRILYINRQLFISELKKMTVKD